MSATKGSGFDCGIFPQGESVVVNGTVFKRRDRSDRRGAIMVFDEDGFLIGHLAPGATTRDEALAWLDGYLQGFCRGKRDGRQALQAEIRGLIGADR